MKNKAAIITPLAALTVSLFLFGCGSQEREPVNYNEMWETTVYSPAASQISKHTADNEDGSEEDYDPTEAVYITKTGQKYHYNNHCNNAHYYETTLEEARRKGLKPCNKCVN